MCLYIYIYTHTNIYYLKDKYSLIINLVVKNMKMSTHRSNTKMPGELFRKGNSDMLLFTSTFAFTLKNHAATYEQTKETWK